MILARWLLRVVGLRVLAAIAAMTAVLQLLDLFEVSTRIIDRGQGVAGVATYAALHAPHLIEQATPFGVLAGALFAFGKLARENAVVVLRSSGLSIYRFTLLAAPAVLAVAAALLVLSVWITPRSDGALADWWRATTPAAEREVREPRTFRLGGDIVVASPGDEAGRRLTQLSLYHRDPQGRLVRRLRADTAVLGSDGWRLLGVTSETYGPLQVVRGAAPSLTWTRRLTPSDVRALFSRDPVLSPGAAHRALTGGAASRPPGFYQTALMQVWAGPAAALVLLLIAAPSALGAVRDGSAVRLTLLCLVAGLLFMVADGVLTSLGSSAVLPAALAAWGAPVLFSGGALAALLHLEGEGARETYVPGRIAIVPVDTKPLMERFIRLPMRVNAGDPSFIPPLLMERREALSPRTNPFFEHADVRFWLATLNGRDVGRISAQVDHSAPPVGGEDVKTGNFGLLVADDDPAIFAALLETAEAWLRTQGCARALGPLNLSTNEEVGLLVDGFDTPPMVMMGHDPAYAGPRLEALGYAKAKDVHAYLARATSDLPAPVRRRVERGPPEGVRLRPLDMSRFDAEVATLTGILNDAWSGNWGFTPTTQAETEALAKALKLVVDPRLTWFAEIDGEPAGVIVFLPNLNEAIADLGGRLLPFGWAKLLWRLKVARVKSARVPLMGVRRRLQRERRGQLLPFLLIHRAGSEALRLGYDRFELSWVLEDNHAMRRIAEAMGARVYKTYRIYEKALAEVGGETLLARVAGALAAAGAARIAVSASDPQVRAAAKTLGAEVLDAAAGPSASVASALERMGAPLLVTTADHALLQPSWVRRFIADAPADADICALLARREAVEAAAPGTRRTYIRLRGGAWSGCNLFLLATPEAHRAVAFWRRVEAQRKRPWRIARLVGPGALLAYATRTMSLQGAARRIGAAAGVRAALVETPFGLCAVDVDTPADLALARRLLARGAPGLSPASAR